VPSSPNAESRQGLLAGLLALIAGYVDAYTFVSYQVYGSFMSGNTTQTGLQAGEGRLAEAGYNLLPIPLFVLGVFAGTLLVHSAQGRQLRWLFGLVAGLLALSLAMGIMNTAVTSVGEQSVSPGYVSGTLNHLAQHLALAARGVPLRYKLGPRDSHGRRAALLAAVWASFLAGALLAGVLTSELAVWSLSLPIAILLLLGAVGGTASLHPGEADSP
jgi:uncharacterized membrane protein YoaK (UPF0700 family)